MCGSCIQHDANTHLPQVARGTADLRSGAAMDEATLDAALSAGRDAVAAEAERGVRVVCIGEVGIGNTTSAAAVLAALTGADASECCGRGTGLDDAGLAHKVQTVREAIQLHQHAVAAQPLTNNSDELRQQTREALRFVCCVWREEERGAERGRRASARKNREREREREKEGKRERE